jgi:membrane associated rhomboid family serine protease
MLPLRDSQPSRRIPFITVILIIFNVVVFIYQQRLDLPSYYEFLDRYAFIKPAEKVSSDTQRLAFFLDSVLMLPPPFNLSKS